MVLHGSFFKIQHKYWEIEFLREIISWQWISLNFDISRKTDHAGLQFYLEVLGFSIGVKLYDCRHWDYEKDAWYIEGKRKEADFVYTRGKTQYVGSMTPREEIHLVATATNSSPSV